MPNDHVEINEALALYDELPQGSKLLSFEMTVKYMNFYSASLLTIFLWPVIDIPLANYFFHPSVADIEPLVPSSPVVQSNALDLNELPQHLETDTDSIFRDFHWLSVSRIHCYFNLPSLAAICKRK